MSNVQVVPKLSVVGADAAIHYFGEVFAAVLRDRHVAAGRVMFAELSLPGGARFQLKEADDVDPDPGRLGGRAVLLSVVTDDSDELARRMVAAGGEIVFEVADQPYGARQGRVRDPFGHEWIIGTPIPPAPEYTGRVAAASDAGTGG